MAGHPRFAPAGRAAAQPARARLYTTHNTPVIHSHPAIMRSRRLGLRAAPARRTLQTTKNEKILPIVLAKGKGKVSTPHSL